MRTNRTIVISLVVALGLAGCSSAPVAKPTPTVLSPSPTATPEPIDVTVVPQNRFGLDCNAVVTPSDVTAILGAETPLAVPDRFDGAWSAVLIQDRAMVCRWGAKNFIDGSSPSISVIAAPDGRAAFDSLVSTFAGDPSPIEMSGVGDAAWASCRASGPDPVYLDCSWTVAVADTWLVVRFLQLSPTEADITPVGDYGQLAATPRADSASAAVVARAAEALRDAPAADVPPPGVISRGCDALANWQLISDEFGLGAARLESYNGSGAPDLYSVTLSRMEDKAAADRGAVRCFVTLGDGADVRETYVNLEVVPDAGWLGSTTLWGGWDAESCHGWEGGPVCELSGYANGRAAFAIIGGTLPAGMAARVFEAIVAP
jgi:hypothetical protein